MGTKKGYDKLEGPETTRTEKNRQLRDAGLLDNSGLMEFEDHNQASAGDDVGGFLKRRNYGDRY